MYNSINNTNLRRNASDSLFTMIKGKRYRNKEDNSTVEIKEIIFVLDDVYGSVHDKIVTRNIKTNEEVSYFRRIFEQKFKIEIKNT